MLLFQMATTNDNFYSECMRIKVHKLILQNREPKINTDEGDSSKTD
jgi:hypothetical protein